MKSIKSLRSRGLLATVALACMVAALSPGFTQEAPGEVFVDEGSEPTVVAGYRFVELASPSVADAAPKKEQSYRKMLRDERDAFRAEAAAAHVAFVERRTYETLFNGLAIEITDTELAKLEALGSVVATYPVYRVQAVTPPVAGEAPAGTTRENVTVSDLTGVPAAHAAGFTGAGVTVGIIDSGVDYNHPALGGPGFPNSKIVGGYDFAENDADPYDGTGGAHGHGTHLAGIVAGNNEVIVGVAPDARIRAYRIFGPSSSPGGTEDIILAAMEMAADDGCEVVNMSLGTSFAGVYQQSVLARAADAMAKRDVVLVAAIGNNNSGPMQPSVPAIAKKAIGVGAAYNGSQSLLAFRLSDGTVVPYLTETVGEPAPSEGTFPVHDYGTANCQPLPAGTFDGQVVLVQRGSFSCRGYDQVNLLAAAGAEAVLWWQDTSNPTLFASRFGHFQIPMTIPAVALREVDARTIKNQGAGAEITWGHYYSEEIPVAGLPWGLSAWGPSHELDFKPDLMAPGAFVFSTLPLTFQGGYYGINSGTSMASPHVAGIAALLRSANPKLKAQNVRKILMNTATPALYTGDTSLGLHPAAQQGAGLVNAMAALSAAVRAEPSKIAVGDLNGVSLHQTITLENNGGSSVTYAVTHTPAVSAAPPFTSYWNPMTSAASVELSAATVTVPAAGTATVGVTISEAGDLPSGTLISGWIEFAPVVGGGPTLRVPYLGMEGDYHDLPAANPTFTDINPSLDNPFLRPESRPNCNVPGPSRPRCCSDPTPGSCSWSIGPSGPQTLDYTNDDKYDDAAFVGLSQGFPMLRKFRVYIVNESGRHVASMIDSNLNPIPELEHWVRNSGAGTGLALFQWHGDLDDGTPAAAGTYYAVLEFHKLLGDGDTYPDLETWTSPAITVVRP